MSKDNIIKSRISESVCMTPNGRVADELTPEEFTECYEMFFKSILEISKADITGIKGYGEFDEECNTRYESCLEYVLDTFTEKNEGYWFNWREMFDTTILDREFFEKYYKEMINRVNYCEGRRFLVYNNAFFVNMITDGNSMVGFPDWSRSGIGDFLIDIAIMDLNKPYLKIPELFYFYCKKQGIEVENYKERFLCMAYYKGIDTLRWHASIDDNTSCKTIMQSISELGERINKL